MKTFAIIYFILNIIGLLMFLHEKHTNKKMVITRKQYAAQIIYLLFFGVFYVISYFLIIFSKK